MAIFEALQTHEGAIEVAEPGVTLRLYYRAGALHFASNGACDASNPVTGAGIDNARALGIDYASQAKRLLEGTYRKAACGARALGLHSRVFAAPARTRKFGAGRTTRLGFDRCDSTPTNALWTGWKRSGSRSGHGLRVSTLQGRMQSASTPAPPLSLSLSAETFPLRYGSRPPLQRRRPSAAAGGAVPARCGNRATGSSRKATEPASVMTIASTVAKIGRSMKKLLTKRGAPRRERQAVVSERACRT